jgi:UDP-glucose 4-epimerase
VKIVITGGAGFLGSHLADAWCEEDVLVIDDLSGGDYENIPQGCLWVEETIQTIPHEYLVEILQGSDVVYHCAALAHEGLSVFSPRTITDSIFGASVALFSACIEAKVPHIVHLSSMARYGRQATPFHEEMIPRPVDPYGIAKVASENVLKALGNVHDFAWSIAIPHNIVGPRQRYWDPFRNVAAIMVNRMLSGKPPVIYGDGEQLRCFSDVRDCIPALVALSEVPGVYNIGPDERWVSINRLSQILADLLGVDWDPVYVPQRPLEVKQAVCSSDRARSKLGYHTRYELEETLQSIIDWVAEKGPREFDYHLPIEIGKGCPSTWKEQLL